MQDATARLRGRKPLAAPIAQDNVSARPAAFPSDLAIPAPVFDLLRLFAARMRGVTPGEVALSRRFAPGTPLTRETVAAAAGELGFSVRFEPHELAAVEERTFPCLVLLNDGTALLATGRLNDAVLLAETETGVKSARIDVIKDRYAGLLLRLEPRIEAEATSPDQGLEGQSRGGRRGQASAPDQQGRSLMREILDHVLAEERGLLMQLALSSALSNSMMIVLPLFIMSVYDRVVPHFAMETLWALAIGVFIAFAIDLGLRTSRTTLLEAIGTNVGNRLQAKFYGRLLQLQLTSTPRKAGSLAGALQELDQLSRLVPQLLISLAVDLPYFLLMLGLLYYIGGVMVIAPLAGLAVIFAASIVAHIRSTTDNALASKLFQQRANQLHETLSAIETVKAVSAEPQLLARWEAHTDNAAFLAYKARHQHQLAANIALTAVQASIVLALVIGVYEVQAGAASIGALAAASLLVGRAMSPMGGLVALSVRGFQLLRTTEAIGAVNAAPIEAAGDRGRPPAHRFAGSLAFRNAGCSYDDGAAPVLRDISLSIEPGERVGLIGRIGCGKSTLLKLLPRHLEANHGALLVDGHDIRQFDPALLRRHIALMPQESVLFDMPLRDNIRFGLGAVDEAAFERAVQVAGVQDFAGRHPEGYGMQVGPRGERLSGGERASVVLARTLLRDPQILLLDEPTASMDNELERRVVARLNEWLGTRTLILATHRAPLLNLVDRIIWLEAGKVIADGPRDEVLQRLKG